MDLRVLQLFPVLENLALQRFNIDKKSFLPALSFLNKVSNRSSLFLQLPNLNLPLEDGIAHIRTCSGNDDSFSRNVFAGHGGYCEVRRRTLNRESSFEIFGQQDLFQKPIN